MLNHIIGCENIHIFVNNSIPPASRCLFMYLQNDASDWDNWYLLNHDLKLELKVVSYISYQI